MKDTVKINSENVKMIAHRGVSGIECENTCAAFVAAGNRSYFGIETDVHITRDGKFAIIHDDNTARVSGGTDLSVENSDYSELYALTLNDKEYGEPRTDLKIPVLDDYVRICKRYEKVAVLELKNRMTDEALAGIIEVIKNEKYLENTIFISFSFDNLVLVKKQLPAQTVQFLTSEWNDGLPALLRENGMDLDIRYRELTAERVHALHENGVKVNCWTCDKKEEATALIGMGVDFITSNILE